MNRERAARTSTAIRINVEDIYGGMVASRAKNARELAPLAASIARHGLLQPVVVRRNRSAGRYALICGARRLAACQMLGIREIDALLIEADEQEAAACFMEEHLTRLRPPLFGEAEVLRRAGGEEVAKRCALPREQLARYERMLGLSERVRAEVEAGELTLEQAEPLLCVPGEERQAEAASIIAQRALTPGQARRLVFGERGLSAVPPKRRAVRAAMEEAERIARRLGGQGIPAGVSVHARERGLCIEIQVKTGDSLSSDAAVGKETSAFGGSQTVLPTEEGGAKTPEGAMAPEGGGGKRRRRAQG